MTKKKQRQEEYRCAVLDRDSAKFAKIRIAELEHDLKVALLDKKQAEQQANFATHKLMLVNSTLSFLLATLKLTPKSQIESDE